MFTPIGSTIPQPVTLVSTALPNSIALRVPYDNVSPSVSSAELNNNASGNRTNLPKTEAGFQTSPAQPEIENIASQKTYPSASNNSVQTNFLAQLAAGDISSEVRGIFAQYEKLVSFANVKYKPSNAGKPVDPVGIFKTLLQIEKESPTTPVENTVEITPLDISENIVIAESKGVAPEILNQEIVAPTEPQLPTIKYNETIARNNNYEQKDLEIA